ncbi:carboxypeptidase G2 [Rodentibacter pneumotropicus]|uniref:Carboxypeptidase G2 n=1 Tax=Rodentibacter pneumotropicus TaxID=758 RepID=A0A448MM87_9PAST|nr:carboxypeptidase G2 [Rodentibacter pneumotropicus]
MVHKKAETQGLQHKRISMTSDKVAQGVFISNRLDAETFDILFVAHMDTVFPLGTGKGVPFTRKDGRINALGVIDDKSGALLSFISLRNWIYQNTQSGFI